MNPQPTLQPTAQPVPGRDDACAARRHLEDREELLFTSRLISVGEMASTLAHEINQPIGAIVNLLRGVKARLQPAAAGNGQGTPAADELRAAIGPALEQALEHALFGARVVARIREYTASRQPRLERVDLAQLLRATAALLDWELQRDGVRLALEIAPAQAAIVLGDAVMLQQVLVNLMRNALDAVRGGAGPRLRLALGADDPPWWTVEVTDNGSGLSAAAEAQLFVPFVSTKPSGMGIGLNICRSFVELHQGRLWFTRNASAPWAGGCTFHVSLPRLADAAETPSDRKEITP